MGMPYMCDALLPLEERYASLKYRRLSRSFDPYRQDTADLVEARALLITPGILPIHAYALMRWTYRMNERLKLLEQLDDLARPLAQANAMAASVEDGEAMLRTILQNRPEWGRTVPMWSTRYLQTMRRRGASVRALAGHFGVAEWKVQRWWAADEFDPLTGLPHPTGYAQAGRRRSTRFRPTV